MDSHNAIIIAVLAMDVVADVGVIAGASVLFGSGREDLGIGAECRERHKRDSSKKSDIFYLRVPRLLNVVPRQLVQNCNNLAEAIRNGPFRQVT